MTPKHRHPTAGTFAGLARWAVLAVGVCGCVHTRSAPPAQSSAPGSAAGAFVARPVGLALRPGLILDGETSLCCRLRMSGPDVTPQLMRECVVIAHDMRSRMQCYEDGFEAAVSPHRARVRDDDFVEIFPEGFEHQATKLETHVCRAVIACPGEQPPVACEASGPGARCSQDHREGTVTCHDESGERHAQCPVPADDDDDAEESDGATGVQTPTAEDGAKREQKPLP